MSLQIESQSEQKQLQKVVEEKKDLAVWEEALIQEFIYAIAHLNHVEQHLIESDSNVGTPIFGDIIDSFREQRKIVGQVMFVIEKLEAMKSGNVNIRSSWESIWCALKHSTTALIHVDECIEKLLKKLKDSNNVELMEYIKTLLRVRGNLLRGIMNMLQRSKVAANILTEASMRCREDLCLEEVEKH
ncbi:hypothetical protein QPL79_03330 [Ignisphaera sp. 4213-co]|uniref:Uncharacterized protein n=1 Tax=Ignisphaera cupida TaxID=3050454 RepID=A0ABD4Z5B0_9CREN|nr:hypothetical protein [Ignisphaera sp. 4213-co]MDK6028394.1 hypothetical protein [Ignisphaera sp. 4213-co]